MKNSLKLYSKLYNIGLFKNKIIKKVINSNSSRAIYYFTNHINKLNDEHKSLLVDKLITISKGHSLYNFVKSVKLNNEELNKISKAIATISDPKIIYNYFSYVKPKDLNIINDMILSIIKAKDPEYIYLFAKKAKLNPVPEKLINAIIETENTCYMKLFIKYVPNIGKEHFKKILNYIIENADLNLVYEIASEYNDYLNNDDLNIITNKIIKSQNSEYIYLYAKNIKKLNDEQLQKIINAIINLNDSEYLYYFLRDIKLYDEKPLFIKRMCDLKNISYLKLIIKNIKLQKSDINFVFNTILSINDGYAYEVMCDIHQMYNDISFLEKDILKSKKMNVILDYMYLTKNINLIKTIFGSIKDFYDVCLITKNIDFNVKDLNGWLNSYVDVKKNYKYIDDNINNYLKI